MPRIYREMPVNSVWEGSANVICLDVRRAMEKSPEAVDAFRAEVRSSAGGNPRVCEASRLFEPPTSGLRILEVNSDGKAVGFYRRFGFDLIDGNREHPLLRLSIR